jgi:hypothetical protein
MAMGLPPANIPHSLDFGKTCVGGSPTYAMLYNVFGTYPIKPKPTHVKRCI